MPAAPLPLWPDHAGHSNPADVPTLTFYPAPVHEPVPCVLVCPGGGYGHLAPHEGGTLAEALNARGLHAAVLTYRLGSAGHRHPAMLQDAQRGMRLIRHHAAAWGVRPDAVAVMGFSAGGHLASTLTVHWQRFTSEQDDLAATISARPDAAILCYPVLFLTDDWCHGGSRKNLLGDPADAELVEQLSTPRQVTAECPPCFLWHTADDGSVPVENSLFFAAACRAARVPVELHVYESGRHGLGLALELPEVATWFDHAVAFLNRHLAVKSA